MTGPRLDVHTRVHGHESSPRSVEPAGPYGLYRSDSSEIAAWRVDPGPCSGPVGKHISELVVKPHELDELLPCLRLRITLLRDPPLHVAWGRIEGCLEILQGQAEVTLECFDSLVRGHSECGSDERFSDHCMLLSHHGSIARRPVMRCLGGRRQ